MHKELEVKPVVVGYDYSYLEGLHHRGVTLPRLVLENTAQLLGSRGTILLLVAFTNNFRPLFERYKQIAGIVDVSTGSRPILTTRVEGAEASCIGGNHDAALLVATDLYLTADSHLDALKKLFGSHQVDRRAAWLKLADHGKIRAGILDRLARQRVKLATEVIA